MKTGKHSAKKDGAICTQREQSMSSEQENFPIRVEMEDSMTTDKQMHNRSFEHIEAFDPTSHALNVIIETPTGRRNKYKYDEKYGLFLLQKVLPAGAVFPFDFGYVPSTLAEDGDPLDILVLMDEEAFVGCLVPSRLIGVIEAEESENGQTKQNPRLIAVALASQSHRAIYSLDQLDPIIADEIEHFFVSYNTFRGKAFRSTGRSDAKRAKQLIEESIVLQRKKA